VNPFRTPKYVVVAEKLAAKHGGNIPNSKWLSDNGHNALRMQMFKYPEKFNHLKQGRLRSRRLLEGMSRTPEYRTAMYHHWLIFKACRKRARTYKGMPYHDEWNPYTDGSYEAAARWIVTNIGSRSLQPAGSSLHIVKHSKGFVPGNLTWASSGKQTAEQMFKIIARQQKALRELRKRLRGCRCPKAK
jgi:hypothetical protein